MNRTMLITNKETKKKLGAYWFGNPFKGIANFPTEEYHGPDCERLVEVENPETGLFEKPTTCTCKPIEKECISEFPDTIWRKAVESLDLPPTTDKEDDDRFNEIILSIYDPLNVEGEVTVKEPVISEIVTNITVVEETKVGEKIIISIDAMKDQFGNAYLPTNTPTVTSEYNLSTVEVVDGKYNITFDRKGVDILVVNVDGKLKKIPVKIRGLNPYPNFIKDDNNIYWVRLSLAEFTEYVNAKVIIHPELAVLVEDRAYYWDELFVNTSAWADIAIRTVSTPEEVAYMDEYRAAVADMLNWIDSEITTINSPISKATAKAKPTLPDRPNNADKYKPH